MPGFAQDSDLAATAVTFPMTCILYIVGLPLCFIAQIVALVILFNVLGHFYTVYIQTPLSPFSTARENVWCSYIENVDLQHDKRVESETQSQKSGGTAAKARHCQAQVHRQRVFWKVQTSMVTHSMFESYSMVLLEAVPPLESIKYI